MKIALLHPSYWPEVRRGSERVVHDAAISLVARGHEVTVITSHAQGRSETVEDGVRVIRRRRPPELTISRWYELHLSNSPSTAWLLSRGDFDIAHAFFPSDAAAAVWARQVGGPPVVHSFHGIVNRWWLVQKRYRLELLEYVVSGAAVNTVLSEAAAVPFRRYLRHDPTVLPAGVVAEDFADAGPRADRPTLVCGASLTDSRKRGDLLLAAFAELRKRLPEARMQLMRSADPFLADRAEPEPGPGVEWIDPGDRPEAFARAYGSAWASVLAAVDEAFGLVMVESLAAGTPVISAASGSGPEIITSKPLGSLFEPDDCGSLADSMAALLKRPPSKTVEKACVKRAQEYDWGHVSERYESLYEQVLGGQGDTEASAGAAV